MSTIWIEQLKNTCWLLSRIRLNPNQSVISDCWAPIHFWNCIDINAKPLPVTKVCNIYTVFSSVCIADAIVLPKYTFRSHEMCRSATALKAASISPLIPIKPLKTSLAKEVIWLQCCTEWLMPFHLLRGMWLLESYQTALLFNWHINLICC